MKKIYVLTVLCLCVSLFFVNPVFSQITDDLTANQINTPYDCEEDLIEIMFNETSQVRLRNGSLVDLKTDALNGISPILDQLDWHNWYRICDVDEDIIDSWSINGERNTGKPVYNMNNIYRLQIPKGKNVWNISKSINGLPGVMSARPVPKPIEPPIPPNYQSNQGYLNPASSTPTGIDATYAWTQTGGTGTGVTICDLEYSWNYNHADITKGIGSALNSWTDPGWGNNHGTAVIGELVSDNNSWGTTGICYGASLKTCGTYYGSPLSWNVPGAILLSVASLSAGDIILLEQQWDYSGSAGNSSFVPIEWWTDTVPFNQTYNPVYAAIVTAVSNGIHVVEAGGNGNVNTGAMTWYGNSGAIIVGAGGASASNDLQRLSFSSYGSRFDLQGWGEKVVTTGYGDYYGAEGANYWYTNTFNGTSSASPIVAGALACAEGYYLANVSTTPPTPAYMRTHLATYGTAQIFGTAGNIGPRPNLYAAINNFPPPQQNIDWGDAPQPYPTLLASNGARHQITSLFLGNVIDPESDGQPNAAANGDDLNGVPNDEDGITLLGPITPGTNVNIQVVASAIGGLLQGWIDFNMNGTWIDAGEQIFLNQVLNPGINNLNFFVPASALPGPTYARFRLSTMQNVPFFAFAPDGEVEDYYYFIEEPQDLFDWGDAPDQPYPTLMANNGANHLIDGITYLGNQVDSEPDGQPDGVAMGDDFDLIYPPPNDDEDGVNFLTPFVQNQMANIDVIASTNTGFLNVWIDLAQDGSWIEPGDHVLMDVPLITGINNLNIWIPSTAMVGQTFVRFRFSTVPGLNFLGQAPDGEVEDYDIFIEEGQVDEFDFGDAPEEALAYPSLGVTGIFPTCVNVNVAGWIEHMTTDLYLGPAFDLENEGNAGLCPSFNPNQYNQDECFMDGDAGLLMPDAFTIVGPVGSETVQPCSGANNQHLGFTCQNAIWGTDIDIDVYNMLANGNQAYLNVLVDWNQDGQWSGSSSCPGGPVQEHVLVDLPIPHGHSGPVSGLIGGLSLPIGPNPGYVWVRFTLTEFMLDNGWNGEGAFTDGETEDYLLLILEQEDEIDYGDASDPSYPTLLANNGARHIIDGVTFLGASIDPEADGQQSTNADGDDLDGNDDEDGVTFDWPLTVGNPCKITVNASVDSALFSGWIDFDGNGSWADAGENIFSDVLLYAGDNDLNFLVPPSTAAGLTTYARFRFSTQPGLSFIGSAFDGEVEDYEVYIDEFGDYKWAQYPDTTLPGLHAYDYVIATYQSLVIADDWLCNGGLVTDFHWWGNYELDAYSLEMRGAGIDHFHISIHAHDTTGGCLPVDPEITGFNVQFTDIVEQNTGLTNIEGCPIYLYEYILQDPFEQEEGKRYWVDITAFSTDPTDPAFWRWQESMRSHFPILCGATDKTNPAPGTWDTIQWANNKYSDMAFIITSVEPDPMDFGDAIDPTYPTLLASNGASHIIDTTLYLGNSIDAESDGQSDSNALGDDNDGNDDEDGVTINPIFSNITPTGLIWYDIIASKAGTLNVWIDWDANGSWAEADNHVAIDVALAIGSNSNLIGVPLNALIGTTYTRFRFSSIGGLSYTGQAPDGEVEDYELIIEGDVDVNLKAFLEGPFNGAVMDTDLNSSGIIPLSQPYGSDATAPWYYTGSESVVSIPNANVVDWVMVEFRDATSPATATAATMVSQQAAFILADGSIVGLDGLSPIQTNGIYSHNLYVVVWHRNHLGIMSSGPIVLTGINQYTYDFTAGPGQAYLSGQKNLSGGIYGMAGGDGKPDGTIDNQDIISVWTFAAGTSGYLMVDYNLDTQVDNQDKNSVWYPNISSGSQVP